jgi:hypothetical protein
VEETGKERRTEGAERGKTGLYIDSTGYKHLGWGENI